MRWNNSFQYLIGGFVGALICFVLTQYEYFEIKRELDIPNLLLTIISLIIGLFIATSLQENFNKKQNKFSFLISKIDKYWSEYTIFSDHAELENQIEISSIKRLLNTVIKPVSFLKSQFVSFKLDQTNLLELEQKLEALEVKISNLPGASNNVVILNSETLDEINSIHIEFSKVFVQIHDM